MLVTLAITCTACGSSQPRSLASPSSTASATPTPSASPPPSSTTVRTPNLPKGVLASIPLPAGSAPTGLVAGFGSIWVESHRSENVYRIDPQTDAVIATINIGHSGCEEPRVGFGRVWVGSCGDNTKTTAINPTSNQVAGSFDGLGVVGFADGAIWSPAVANTRLLRIDPISLRTTGSIVVPGGAGVYDGHDIWMANADYTTGYWLLQEITELDPVSKMRILDLRMPDTDGEYPWLHFADGSVWVKSSNDPLFFRIKVKSGTVQKIVLHHDSTLSQFTDQTIADSAGTIFVRSSDAGVTRLDARTGHELGQYPADPAGGGGYLTVAYGSLWVANFGTDTIWRDRL